VIATFITNLILALRLVVAVPWMSPLDAYAHATAASAHANARVSPELLLAIAYVESRYDPTATSRVESGSRRTGAYPSSVPPAHLDAQPLYCGPLQTYASSWSACVAMRDLDTGYADGAAELEQWLRDARVRGDVTRALAGHGCGNAGVLTGSCNHYPERVLALRQWIEHPVVKLRPASS
jgi:hypothetical protein